MPENEKEGSGEAVAQNVAIRSGSIVRQRSFGRVSAQKRISRPFY